MNGQKLRELRKAKGVTQREAALQTGLTEQTIYNIEKGVNTNPTLATIQKIANYYGVPVVQLIEEK